jgi:Methyltransferase domain
VGVEACRVCGGEAGAFGTASVLRSVEVAYFRCEACGFVQTEEPHWLQRAYEEPIADTDVGILSRNIALADKTAAVISLLCNPDSRFLDWGGGYGILVRLMRDRGFDFYWRDLFCENLFARGFEQAENLTRVELLTAFEVLEHLPRPVDDLAAMSGISDNLLVSTQLLPDPAPAPGEWWYYALEAGQHVSLYSRRALAVLAEQQGMFVASNSGESLHLFTRSRRATRAFPFVVSRPAVWVRGLLPRHRSLLESDYERASGSPLS